MIRINEDGGDAGISWMEFLKRQVIDLILVLSNLGNGCWKYLEQD
jgi:hypothetical protein